MAFVRTIIHIGLPRTASTFLQREVFPKFKGFEFYGVDQTFYSERFQKLLYQDTSLYHQPSRKELIATEAQNLLLSNELFSGQSFSMNATNRSRTAKRLKIAFPEAEILLILRNQLSLLESLYAIAVYSGYFHKPEEFVNFGNSIPRYSTFTENEHTETYLLNSIIEFYRRTFEKVHIFLFEDFAANPNYFINEIEKKLEVELDGEIAFAKKENKSLSKRQIRYFRKINRSKSLLEWNNFGKTIFGRKVWFGEHVIGGNKRFQFGDELSEKIRNYYRKDNQLLAETLGEMGNSETFKSKYLF